jgi:hypothetical protein
MAMSGEFTMGGVDGHFQKLIVELDLRRAP